MMLFVVMGILLIRFFYPQLYRYSYYPYNIIYQYDKNILGPNYVIDNGVLYEMGSSLSFTYKLTY